ncbi:hypothetical protein DICVIV_05643 [Dictyocaulus viviparus]|uniref:Solute carrier family 35 member F1 n=1 Tax=Dictyocaulus viviparus TaxID=29172 RepID=A0A0D8Y106_DICVI|nr:hypothetical protein DICVIV_05643 [Dictyocaulus viviparus]
MICKHRVLNSPVLRKLELTLNNGPAYPHGFLPPRNPFATQRQPPPRSDSEEDGINCSPCCDNENVSISTYKIVLFFSSRTFRSVALGQILSLCLCGTGISSQLLSNQGVNAPATQSFTNYFLLCFVYCTALSCKSGENGLLAVMRRRGLQYFILALIDVEANYMIVSAYQFTNLTSVQLLDCSTIPMVLLLSWLFLSVRYLISHIIGVCICLVGIACLIWADILDGKGSIGGNHRVIGDMLCLGGSLLYAIANVSEEFLVKQNNRVEYLGMVGLFGSLISGVQLAILEHKNLALMHWNSATISCFILFAISMFMFYSLVTVVLQKTSALMFNLAILTADFYSLLCGLFLFKDSFHYLYFVSFVVVIVGSVIYSLRETQRRDPNEPRRVCPCLFVCCCCCDCCFDEMESTEGSLEVSPTIVVDEPSYITMYAAQTDTRNCPIHGRRTTSTPSTEVRYSESRH